MSDLKDNRLDDFLVKRDNRLELEKKPLLKATLALLPYKRQGLKVAVKKEQLSVTFDQLRSPTEAESLREGMSEALFTAIRGLILQQKLEETNPKVHLTRTSKENRNGTHQSGYLSHFKYGIPINEFVKRGDYVHQMFESLARKMNSAQNINPAIGFNATLTFIAYPEKGGKGPASKNPGRLPFNLMHKKKDCMIAIKNQDELCCACGIVTMKEYVDGDLDKQYDNPRRGKPIQERLAKQLHRDAEVPKRPWGIVELEQFQTFLGPKGYKIIVVDCVSSAIIFQGKVADCDKVIYLLN